MMTEKEMIEILEAYQRGEKIEFCDERIKEWQLVNNPSWDFSRWQYRIKPKSKKKKQIINDIPFKKGELYIHKEDLNKYFVDTKLIHLVTNIKRYDDAFEIMVEQLSDNSFGRTITIDRYKAERRLNDYLNIHDDSLLWYWEYMDSFGQISITPYRHNHKEAIIFCEKNMSINKRKLLYPVYSLGCVIKDKVMTKQILGFEMKKVSFQGGGAGSYLGDNDQADTAESRFFRSKPNLTKETTQIRSKK